MTKSIRDILNEAAVLIETGWCNHYFCVPAGTEGIVTANCYCASGAISKAGGGIPDADNSGATLDGFEAMRSFAKHLYPEKDFSQAEIHELESVIGRWNDCQIAAPFVIHELRKAALPA